MYGLIEETVFARKGKVKRFKIVHWILVCEVKCCFRLLRSKGPEK